MTLGELASLDCEEFVRRVGWVFEHSPWVAERAWDSRPFASRDDLHAKLCAVMWQATEAEQLALLRAHPDLGARARMSDASAGEQAGAGLDRLTPEEFATLQKANTAYKDKFGFPFLYAVKGSTKYDILRALAERLENSRDREFPEALRQVARIAAFRLEDLIS